MTAAAEPQPRTAANERDTLTGFLDHYRGTLAHRCDGLDAAQLAERAVPPSSLSLLGLVRHMGDVERGWFRGFAGERSTPRYFTDENPDGDFLDAFADDDAVSEAMAYWQAEIAHAREIVAGMDLDATYLHPRHHKTISLRWIVVHMIEEYARHCGHADLLRERIDGVTG